LLRFLRGYFERPLRDILRDEARCCAIWPRGERLQERYQRKYARGREMSSWWVDPALPPEARRAFASLDRGVRAGRRTDRQVAAEQRAAGHPRWPPLLRQALCRRSWQSLLRNWFGLRSRLLKPPVQKEWENLLAFQGWGIPTARLVAYGLERHGGRFVRGALITEELADTVDMAQMARDGDPGSRTARWVAAVSRQLAQATRPCMPPVSPTTT
jgi:hypothetical protein